MRQIIAILATIGSTVAMASSAIGAPRATVAQHCNPAPALSGRLSAMNMTCALARRVSAGYFGSTQPGQHEGPARVLGFACTGSFRSGNFHITCRRGRRVSHFIGVAAQ